MSDTPRTGAAMKYCFGDDEEFVKADFARQLERELNAANERVKRLEKAVRTALKMRMEYLDLDKDGDGGYVGAYYSFCKSRDEEWDTLAKSLEATR